MEAAFADSPAPMASQEDLAPERHRPPSAASDDQLPPDTSTAHASFSTNSSEFPRFSPSRALSTDFVCSSLRRPD